MLEDRVFSTDAFQKWAKEGNAVLFAAVMTKIEGREDDALLRTHGFSVFPSLALLDDYGRITTKRIDRNLGSIARVAAAAPAYCALRKKVDAGQDYDASKWYVARLRMDELSLPDAERGLKEVTLSPKDRALAEKEVFALQMNDFAARSRPRRDQPARVSQEKAAAAVFAAFKSGKRLPSGAKAESFVDSVLVKAGGDKGDAEAFFYSYERVAASMKDSIKRHEILISSLERALKSYQDNERTLAFIEGSIDSSKKSIERTKARLAKLHETARSMRQKK